MLTSYQRAAAEYRRTEIQSGTPLELVVRLYDGALSEMARAGAAMRAGDLPAKGEALSRSFAIIGELQASLDLTRGGDVAASLDSLYSYVTAKLTEANVKRDPDTLDHLRSVLAPLRDAWRQIATEDAARRRGA